MTRMRKFRGIDLEGYLRDFEVPQSRFGATKKYGSFRFREAAAPGDSTNKNKYVVVRFREKKPTDEPAQSRCTRPRCAYPRARYPYQ
jgi:hypothetical protein